MAGSGWSPPRAPWRTDAGPGRWTASEALDARLGYNPLMTALTSESSAGRTAERTADPTADLQAGPVDPGLPVGLTEADLDRIAAAATASRAATTRTVYAAQWRLWERWCAARGVELLAGDPVILCAYLTERAASGCPWPRSTWPAPPSATPTSPPGCSPRPTIPSPAGSGRACVAPMGPRAAARPGR